MSNDHGGWDATWDEVSSKYCGIVRSDVIFLLKRCYICSLKPGKQPKRNVTSDETPSSSSSLPGSSSEPQTSQGSPQFYGQQAPEQQDFDQVLDQYSQETFDYNFGNDFGYDSFQNGFQNDGFQNNGFQNDSFQYGNYEGLDQLWNEEMPAVGHPDVDMANMVDMTNIDPALLSNDFSNNNFSDFAYTYPFPEEASGSDTYPYDLDFMQDSV
jgi:hypothetical protein